MHIVNGGYEIVITGIVQGVGFRPFIYAMAKSLSLTGEVSNTGSSVVIHIEGKYDKLQTFLDSIKNDAPPLSHIKDIRVIERPYTGYKDFLIIESEQGGGNTYISPDVSICDQCKNELFSKDDHRYLYPFINCTNCGPRFTIVKGVPYDRKLTTMDKFNMCPRCSSEYTDPFNRRYHAQPVSCYNCGPELTLFDSNGEKVGSSDIIKFACDMIRSGKIIAIKGLGGYHLACSAQSSEAVERLRKRKIRDEKPFALMVKDIDTALEYCHVNEAEKKLMESHIKPIVLLARKENVDLPDSIAPNNPNLGIMLPYTPLHLLLFYMTGIEALVMTSGNRSSEPIYYKDEEAFQNLKDIADYFLSNNRDIYIRTDDSVTRVFKDREYIIRRSRGYVPMPVTFNKLPVEAPSVLACGGELKNTFCLSKGNEFYLSHHIGDLENAETFASFEEGIEHFEKILNINYSVVSYDLHPEYLSTKYALEIRGARKYAIQHHHAHIASCMAENDIDGNVIGVAFDGTGYGEDGNIWGGEFFTGSYEGFKRVGYLEYVRMPGGEMAVKEPWRMAVSYLCEIFEDICDKIDNNRGIDINGTRLFEDVDRSSIRTVLKIIEKRFNSPLTSSMGRLFDAVSALLGLRSKISYEGQAAIELEFAAQKEYHGEYVFSLNCENGFFRVNTFDIIKAILKDLGNSVDKGIIAARFHETVAEVVRRCCLGIRKDSGLNRVALSGGVFQNITLLDKCVSKLEESRFNVFIHSSVPANDGGIALGQAVMAVYKMLNDEKC